MFWYKVIMTEQNNLWQSCDIFTSTFLPFPQILWIRLVCRLVRVEWGLQVDNNIKPDSSCSIRYHLVCNTNTNTNKNWNKYKHKCLLYFSMTNHIVPLKKKYNQTRSLGALRAPTSSWRPFEPLDFVLRALRALRPCDPSVGDWIVCYPLDSVLAVG